MFKVAAGAVTRELLGEMVVTNDQTFALMSANLKGENGNLLSSGFSIYEPIKVFVEHPGFVPGSWRQCLRPPSAVPAGNYQSNEPE